MFARVKVPLGILPRLVPLPEIGHSDHAPGTEYEISPAKRFVLLEDLIQACIGELFRGHEVLACFAFRVTRDADLEVDEEDAEDLLESMEDGLRRRRFGEVVRVELDAKMPQQVRQELLEYLEMAEHNTISVEAPLGLADLFPLCDLPLAPDARRELLFPGFSPGAVEALNPLRGDVFTAIRAGDILVHHPYQSFVGILEVLQAAARDPEVLAIKQTLYRPGNDPTLVNALLKAAEAGKQVVALVELKARFDEARNITWAKTLEQAGVHVVYGVPNLKTHAKITLVVRREADGLRRYVHMSTGNYNPRTAKLYTDLGLLTANTEIGRDASMLFNALTGYCEAEYKVLSVAPDNLRQRLLTLIEREAEHARAGRPARLVAKVNSLTDTEIIDALYNASEAGLPIDLVVRGVCCLRPGVIGQSENIRVRSIIGRFLEHSRIMYLENGGEPEVYLSSADWMGRNLNRRIELLFPVRDEKLRGYLRDAVLGYALDDTVGAWVLTSEGEYQRAQDSEGVPGFASQLALARLHGLVHGPQ
jgi:polyphosphate kinase